MGNRKVPVRSRTVLVLSAPVCAGGSAGRFQPQLAADPARRAAVRTGIYSLQIISKRIKKQSGRSDLCRAPFANALVEMSGTTIADLSEN